MRLVRFYEDFPSMDVYRASKKDKTIRGNKVIAIYLGRHNDMDGRLGVKEIDGEIKELEIECGYVNRCCRCSEKVAREIHPFLFEYLDSKIENENPQL